MHSNGNIGSSNFFCLAGVIIEFTQTKIWDSMGCSILACNTAIFCAALTAYNKKRKRS